ncbi:hypothetical protein JCGZ_11012 [Jatropha curcas]|uniref:Uncharacterized protein n=1 Tax=Jatropha curcas TaxID=180498 RepID=A0A067KS74_JATCU|nr:hypothetical protein JCGZ_11012 [Jatropha curcas]
MARSGKTYPTLQAWECPVNKGTFGLGYEPTDEDLAGRTEGSKKKSVQMRPYLLTLNGLFCKPGETIPYCGFPEPFYFSTAKKMLPGLEIFADAWDDKPEAITELEIEDLMQPSLFDEVAVITSNDGNQDLLSLIKPNKGPFTNWYNEEERAADKTLPEPNLEDGPHAKSCTESESDPESEIESESSSESSVSDLENPDFKFDVIFGDDSVLINKSLQIIGYPAWNRSLNA